MYPMHDDENIGGRDGRNTPRGPQLDGARGHHDAPFGFGRRFGNSGHQAPGGAERDPGGYGGHSGHGGGFGFGPGRPGFGPGPGFGFGREGRRARRGDVRLAILSLLGEGEANGYTLIKTIAERTDGAWRPSPGSVYPTLQQLVDEGLVVGAGDDGKSTYALTEEGRAEVADKADEIARAWDTAPGMSDTQRDFTETLRKTFGVLHMYRQNATEAQIVAATEKVDRLRKELLQILAD